MKSSLVMKKSLTLFLILTVVINSVASFQNFFQNLFQNREVESKVELGYEEDAFLTVPELITKYKHPVEIHTVETEDGFILELHRIPKPGAIPVLVLHGLLASSAEFVILGPQKGLAYYLSHEGYDVWLGNARGNRYSRKHKTLNAKDKEFWDFSFHELGKYDIPSMINYITNETKYEKIHYIGHSQGTTSFWAMCALQPEYCDKIISMQALAPVAYFDNTKCAILAALAPISNKIEYFRNILGVHEVLTDSKLLSLAGQALCKDRAITQAMCTNLVFLIAGYDSQQFNQSMLPVFLGHFPAGASVKQLIHFAQNRLSRRFQQYDYGYLGNWVKYGSIQPPIYDLSKVSAPVVLHYSSNDLLADVLDVRRLSNELPNVVERDLIADPKFNHLDFLTAIDVVPLLYQRTVKNMKELERKQSKT